MCIECKFLFGFCLKMVVKFSRVMKALLGIYNHRNIDENKCSIKSDMKNVNTMFIRCNAQ